MGFLGLAIPALIGFALGASGYFVLWSRARRTPDLIARAGMGRTFQNIRLFGELSVLENVLVGMHAKLHCGFVANMLRLPRYFRENVMAQKKAAELLRFVGLQDRANDAARNLPYGLQRRLEIARALAGEPRILLLDEPAAGMNPTETSTLMDLIRRIRDSGVTVLLIEHHMRVVMGVSDRICVLNFGKQIAQGTPEQIRSDPACIEAYLGKEELG
ncbi:MAG: ABC transporter ATP-binding protein [Planctomycetes bacterium]|nr:ABC transporter ATP-binding protein [Planctomycetota bacterium]